MFPSFIADLTCVRVEFLGLANLTFKLLNFVTDLEIPGVIQHWLSISRGKELVNSFQISKPQ